MARITEAAMLLSTTQADLLRAAEMLQALASSPEQTRFLDAVVRVVKSWQISPHPLEFQPPALEHPKTGWWRAATKLGEALSADEDRAQLNIRTAFRIAESLRQSKGVGPKLVFHYTTFEGLKGIVESGRIRATHFEYLNDPDEVHYCRALFGDRERASDPDADDPIFFGEEYIASFSELGDDLQQWRTYANGGAGVAVGFVRGSKFGLPPLWHVRWVQVEYSESKHRKLVNAGADMFELAPAMKRSIHAFEREWRLVAHTGAFLDVCPPVVLRPSKFGLTPTVDLVPEGDLLPIQEVVLGPKAGPKAWYSVALLLRSRGYRVEHYNQPREEGVIIRTSSCRLQ